MRHLYLLLPIAIFALLTGCARTSDAEGVPSFPYPIEEKTLEIPGIEREYRLLFLSDLHIIAPDDPQVNEEKREEVEARRLAFQHDGTLSADLWEEIAPAIDSLHADAVLFGGDMIDYCSGANISLLKKGLAQIETPYLYVRADHDTETWYTDQYLTREEANTLQDDLADAGAANDDILSLEPAGGSLLLVGINNSTSQFTASGLDTWNTLLDRGQPTVVITHVPLKPQTDTALLDRSKAAWQDRALVWGADCYHVPNPLTAAAYDRLYSTDSPVALVLAGHLHFSYEGPLTDTTTQIVFAPAYETAFTLLHLVPAK